MLFACLSICLCVCLFICLSVYFCLAACLLSLCRPSCLFSSDAVQASLLELFCLSVCLPITVIMIPTFLSLSAEVACRHPPPAECLAQGSLLSGIVVARLLNCLIAHCKLMVQSELFDSALQADGPVWRFSDVVAFMCWLSHHHDWWWMPLRT